MLLSMVILQRRRMNLLDNEKLDESIERTTTCFLSGSDVHSNFGDIVPTSKSPSQLNSGLAEQAALFGHLMMNASTQVWNKPCCVEIRSPPPGGAAAPPACLKLFPYVPTGSRLLRPTISTKAHCTASESVRMRICSTSTNSLWLSHNGSENNLHNMEQSTEVDGGKWFILFPSCIPGPFFLFLIRQFVLPTCQVRQKCIKRHPNGGTS